MKLLLIASTGGHLTQLLNLREAWDGHDRRWVTFRKTQAESALADEAVTWAHHPTTRNLGNAVRNLVLAVAVLARHRPDVVVSSGAGVALPFFVAARIFRIRTLYLEVFERTDQPSLTGKLVYPLTDRFCLQWEEQKTLYPDGVYVGRAL